MLDNWFEQLKNLNLNEKQFNQLDKYYQLIVEYNKKFNLTTITEKEAVYYKHFFDALLISNFYQFENQNVCDVGSGLGVPGIVLKICFPEINLTIVESNQKKCHFLMIVIKELSLENVFVINQRAEDFAHQYRETFDLVLARALASLTICIELCLGLTKINGFFVAYKSLKSDFEIINSKNCLSVMGGVIKNNFNMKLPKNYGTRNLIFIEKKQLSPLKYPRNYQQIKNKPL